MGNATTRPAIGQWLCVVVAAWAVALHEGRAFSAENAKEPSLPLQLSFVDRHAGSDELGEEIVKLPPTTAAALTYDDLIRIAVECNPTLVQARMAVRAAEGGYVQAGLYPNPVAGYIADEMGADRAQGLQGGFIGQEVVTNGKLRLGRAVAGHEIQQTRHAWETQRQRVMNDVRVGYFATLLAERKVQCARQMVDIEQQVIEITDKLRAAREVSEVDVLQARIEAESTGLKLKEAEYHYHAIWRRLAAVLGRPEMPPASLVGDIEHNLPLLTWEEILPRVLAESPEIAQARAGVERAQCNLALQRAERVPNFEVGAAVKRDTSSKFTVVDFEIGAPLMVFNRNQGNIRKAEAELIAARKEVRRIELELCDRLAGVYELYSKARNRVETYAGKILPQAEKSLALTRLGYREGEFGYLTLLVAERTYRDVSLDYYDSLEEMWSQTVELEGLLLRGGLQVGKRG